MDVTRRRAGIKTNIVAGSVWETRIKLHEASVGNKACNDALDDGSKEAQVRTDDVDYCKRRTWRSESFDSGLENEASKSQIMTFKTPGGDRLDASEEETLTEVTGGDGGCRSGGTERSPILQKNVRTIRSKWHSASSDGADKSPIHSKKGRGDKIKGVIANAVFTNQRKGRMKEMGTQPNPGLIRNIDNVKQPKKCQEVSKMEEPWKEFEVCEEKIIPDEATNQAIRAHEQDKVKINSIGASEVPERVESENLLADKGKFNLVGNKRPPFSSNEEESSSPTKTSNSVLQDMRRSYVFVMGMIILLSSSYSKALNLSFFSMVSHLCLTVIALNFLHKALVSRTTKEAGLHKIQGIAEEEAIRMLKLLLPYLNRSILRIKACSMGDPRATLKVAVTLFLLARFGSFINLSNLSILGLIFILLAPMIRPSFSAKFATYVLFCIGQVNDAWSSCQHKKAISLAAFIALWNFSSNISRVWELFMVIVIVQCHHQYEEEEDPDAYELKSSQKLAHEKCGCSFDFKLG